MTPSRLRELLRTILEARKVTARTVRQNPVPKLPEIVEQTREALGESNKAFEEADLYFNSTEVLKVWVVLRTWPGNEMGADVVEAWSDERKAKKRAEYLTNMAMDTRHPDTIPEYEAVEVELDRVINDPLWKEEEHA